MKRTYSTNGIVVFSFIVISIAVLAAGLLMFFTNADVKREVPKGSSNIIQTSRPTILPSVYPACVGFGEDKKWGLIDKTGKFVVKPKYDEIMDFQDNGYAVVGIEFGFNAKDTSDDGWRWGLINSKGVEVIPTKYENSIEFSDGVCVLKENSDSNSPLLQTVIDEKLKILFSREDISIQNYHDEYAMFIDNKTLLEGYIDKNGREIIKPIYKFAYKFFNGRALVSENGEVYKIINTLGEVIVDLKKYPITGCNEGLISFSKDNLNVGFLNMDGDIVIQPTKIDEAFPFSDGYAQIIASGKNEFDIKYGLIDRTGKVVVKSVYSSASVISKDLFEVSKDVKAANMYGYFVPKALINESGKLVSEFLYYEITEAKNGYFSVTDGRDTFFIDRNGKIQKNLPRLKGVGTIVKVNDLFKSDIDGILSYLNEKGKVIRREKTDLELANDIKIKMKINRNGFLHIVKYPEISGLKDNMVSKNINMNIKKWFNKLVPYNEEDYNYSSVDVNYSASYIGGILSITKYGYAYYMGAAHPSSFKEIKHFNTETGDSYNLEDLFIRNSDYRKKLNNIIRKQASNNKDEYFEPKKIDIFNENRLFSISKVGLSIIFEPYEIASYGNGMPTFEIKFSEIDNIIDKNGAFWKALTKKRKRS